MGFDHAYWQDRLDTLRARHHVPGATLAVLAGGELHELASGVLHRGTGVAATADSVFQAGSIAKVYTATLVLQLADAGLLDLDTRVADVLPGFAVADPDVTRGVTIGQLLTHTSGIAGDFTLDTGRGDDCLARYVAACAEAGQDCPPGTVISYSSTGYALLGRVVEVLTGRTWDAALRERVLEPLGLEHTMTLPEEALRFRTAMSHLGEPGAWPEPAPVWDLLPRSAGPSGRVLATAGDLVRFARAHLDGGTPVLSAGSAALMRSRAVECLDTWSFMAGAWGARVGAVRLGRRHRLRPRRGGARPVLLPAGGARQRGRRRAADERGPGGRAVRRPVPGAARRAGGSADARPVRARSAPGRDRDGAADRHVRAGRRAHHDHRAGRTAARALAAHRRQRRLRRADRGRPGAGVGHRARHAGARAGRRAVAAAGVRHAARRHPVRLHRHAGGPQSRVMGDWPDADHR
ncbi:serine hydrolase domain-containing protein [Nonomuraea salmonea]|uniref:serine hydrolase domain-containing protein n=1 Tax=Nonomuraea salmonea TaxID=46181 RepID=UPI0031E857FF